MGSLSVKAVKQNWNEIIARIQKTNKSAAPYLRDAEVISLKGSELTIGFFYPLHEERFKNDKTAVPQLEKILSAMFGTQVRVKCILSPKRAKMQAAQDDPLIRAGMNLGGKVSNIIDDESTEN